MNVVPCVWNAFSRVDGMDASELPECSGDRVLDERTVDPDPLHQFASWYAQAGETVNAPEAMSLATADARGSTAR